MPTPYESVRQPTEEADLLRRRLTASKTYHSCLRLRVLAEATASPSSKGMLNRGVGGERRSSSTRDRSWNEYRQPSIKLKMRLSRLSKFVGPVEHLIVSQEEVSDED